MVATKGAPQIDVAWIKDLAATIRPEAIAKQLGVARSSVYPVLEGKAASRPKTMSTAQPNGSVDIPRYARGSAAAGLMPFVPCIVPTRELRKSFIDAHLMGRPVRKPCISLQLCSLSKVSCSTVSTPSATMPRLSVLRKHQDRFEDGSCFGITGLRPAQKTCPLLSGRTDI